MRRTRLPTQPWLLPYRNPLATRMGEDFFRSLPKTPGVYLMLGASGSILYVGKAKNLRTRLASYKRARPDQVSRKTIRLLNVIQRITWEECPSERAALLRENALIRKHRPPFNVVNRHPEGYYFIACRVSEKGATELVLTTHGEGPLRDEGFELFGAFKGRGRIREGFAALLRLLWLCSTAELPERFEFPGPLLRKVLPDRYGLRLRSPKWNQALKRFLRGNSHRVLLSLLTAELLELHGIPPFLYRFIQGELDSLKLFYELGPGRNRRLRRAHGLPYRLIAQGELDDLLVTARAVEPARHFSCDPFESEHERAREGEITYGREKPPGFQIQPPDGS